MTGEHSMRIVPPQLRLKVEPDRITPPEGPAHISVVLTLQILDLLRNSGAAQTEALAALNAAHALLGVSMHGGSRCEPPAEQPAVNIEGKD